MPKQATLVLSPHEREVTIRALDGHRRAMYALICQHDRLVPDEAQDAIRDEQDTAQALMDSLVNTKPV